MKKVFVSVFTLLVLATLFLVGCGSQKFDSDRESHKGASVSEERINFDLSEYNDHGNLSCGLIWVKKTESTWNSAPQDCFAYFDANGTQKSRWFSCDEYWPEDFQNNYVVLRGAKRAFEDNWDYHRCIVYNKSFSEITSLYCRMPALSPCYISDFNTQGYSFAVAYDEKRKDDVLYWIDAQGEHIFQDPIDSEAYPPTTMVDEYSLGKFKYSNDYFVLVDGSGDPDYLYTKIAQIYDKNGNFILDLEHQMRKHTEDCAITSAEVLDDNIVEFCFYGMDKNKYICVMDFDGNFIKTPVLQSEYTRPSEDEYQKYSEEWKEADNPPKRTSYAAFEAAAIDDVVTIECYVQATQSWWENTISVYAQDTDGGFFIYNMACSKEDAAKLSPGTKICVSGTKGLWNGEVEILDGTFTFVEGGDTYIAEAKDVTSLIGKEALIDSMNQLIAVRGAKIEKISYNQPGNDIYITTTVGETTLELQVEGYLTGTDSDVYKTVAGLKEGDIVDIEGFLYWYGGALPHITSIKPS